MNDLVLMIKLLVLTLAIACGSYAHASGSEEQAIRSQIHDDVRSLSELQFSDSTEKYRLFFGPALDGKALSGFFLDRIRRIDVAAKVAKQDPSLAASCAGVIMTIYPLYMKQNQVTRWSLLLHEAHHSNKFGVVSHAHAICASPYVFVFNGTAYKLPKNALEGSLGCDDDAEGSYSVQAAFDMAIINFCTNCTAEMRRDASVDFMNQGLLRITNAGAAQKLFESAVPNWEILLPKIELLLQQVVH